MGSKQTSETKSEILNNTDFRNAVKNSNTLINDVSTSLIQNNLMKTSSGTTVRQSLKISGQKSSGDITISGLSQKADVTINVSILSDTQLKQDLVQDVTNELRQTVKNLSDSSQKQLEQQGEQIFASIVGDLSKTMQSLGQSVTGGTSKDKSEATLKNIIQVDNDTDFNNLVNESISTEIVNNTVNEVASSIVGDQSIEIANQTAEGNIVISDISQEILTNQIQNSVQKSGLAESIVAKFSGFTQTDIENTNKASQDLTKKSDNTFDSLGNLAEKTLGGVAGIVSSSTLPFAIIGVAVIIGGLLFIYIWTKFFMGGSGSSGDNSGGSGNTGGNNNNNDNDNNNNENDNENNPKSIAEKLTTGLQNSKNQTSNTSSGSSGIIISIIIILVILIGVILMIYYLTRSTSTTSPITVEKTTPDTSANSNNTTNNDTSTTSNNTTNNNTSTTSTTKPESFTNSMNLNNLYIMMSGQWLNTDKSPQLSNDTKMAQRISVSLIDQRYLYIFKSNASGKQYLSYNPTQQQFEFMPFQINKRSNFTFRYIPVTNEQNQNIYFLKQNDQYITYDFTKKKLMGTILQKQAIPLKFVENLKYENNF